MCHEITEIYDYCKHGISCFTICERRYRPDVGLDLGPAGAPPHSVLMTEVLKQSACAGCVERGATAAERGRTVEPDRQDDPVERLCERDADGNIKSVRYLGVLFNVRGGLRDAMKALEIIDDGMILATPSFATGLASLEESTHAVGLRQHERVVELSRWFSALTSDRVVMINNLQRLIDDCRANRWAMKLKFADGPLFCKWW
jgi:hypothetical protein